MTRADKLFPRGIPFDDAAVVSAGGIDRDDRFRFLAIPGDGDRFLVRTEGFDRRIWTEISDIGNNRISICSGHGDRRWRQLTRCGRGWGGTSGEGDGKGTR